ncbi:MAG: [FeFe] hydrogenase H-cluster maturation GTPase HydF [Alistipes sp.]|nr:[FeFe] hydrogenase H-cluster maturation GTPase HydF [Alistipes sp.]
MALTTPKSERVHISLFGRTNAGKSSLLNRLVGQDVAIVSATPGTTTDPVQKSVEINGLGAALYIDTPGLDDNTTLGGERMMRTAKSLDSTDIAIVLFTDSDSKSEYQIIDECRVREIPTIVVVSQVDRLDNAADIAESIERRTKLRPTLLSAVTGDGIDELLARIVAIGKSEDRLITEGFCEAGDKVLLVMPQDKAAPKGRLIQPQVQTIRELLDRGCIPICCTPDRMAEALAALGKAPELIITDSQAFNEVYDLKPEGSVLTSFSILFARYKGDIKLFTEGVKALKNLNEKSRILIAEACSHTPQNEDIGRVKLPRILRKRFGDGLHIDIVGGADYPEDLSEYDLVIHCGACMFNRRHVLSRIERARKQGVAITNYGVILAALGGILERVKTE